MSLHENRLIHLTPRFRQLQVLHSERLTPNMQRIVLGGTELEGFESPAPDDHVKLFFPNAEGVFVLPELTAAGPRYPEGQVPSPARDYTPRHHDAAAGELVLDFVLHGLGVAAAWAANAQAGDALVVAGPRGSHLVADDYDAYVLIGDETALPAIARRLAELPASAVVTVRIQLNNPADQRVLASAAQVDLQWVNALPAAVEALALPPGAGFVWAAGEHSDMAAVRRAMLAKPGVDPKRMRISAYWKRGAADHHEDLVSAAG